MAAVRTHELEPEKLMVAVLDPPVGRGRKARRELMYQLEGLVPLSIDEVHAVLESTADRRVLACAGERKQLERLRQGFERVVPASLPEWLELADGEEIRERLNLLTGIMRLASHVRRVWTPMMVACAATIAMVLLVFLGASRRGH